MIGVAAAAGAGWLLLFLILLAGRIDKDGFAVTLADLAARGWFALSGMPDPAGPVMGPVMCTVSAETPAEPLAPYERRVMAHVGRLAGVRSEVPAPALSDSFEGGETAFVKAFREEVTADAEQQRRLRRPRLSGRRIGLLCLRRAPGAVAVFAATGQNLVWSSYRGSLPGRGRRRGTPDGLGPAAAG